jgi:hypothetical protein
MRHAAFVRAYLANGGNATDAVVFHNSIDVF